MEGIRKAMNERNLNEGQWEDRKQWSFETDIYMVVPIELKNSSSVICMLCNFTMDDFKHWTTHVI